MKISFNKIKCKLFGHNKVYLVGGGKTDCLNCNTEVKLGKGFFGAKWNKVVSQQNELSNSNAYEVLYVSEYGKLLSIDVDVSALEDIVRHAVNVGKLISIRLK